MKTRLDPNPKVQTRPDPKPEKVRPVPALFFTTLDHNLVGKMRNPRGDRVQRKQEKREKGKEFDLKAAGDRSEQKSQGSIGVLTAFCRNWVA